MKISYVEWPASLLPDSPEFERIARQLRNACPDVLVTNEMPFGDWIWNTPVFDPAAAERSVQLHEQGLAALRSLQLPCVVSSRPVWAASHVANEAFSLEDGRYTALHQKHYFPEEAGWYEASWFRIREPGFTVSEAGGLRIGVLLCTELMFTEHARAYGRAGADLIVVPRAAGQATQRWKTACAMAALVSGCYVVTSNRQGLSVLGAPHFGGSGMAFAPDGSMLGETSGEQALGLVELDLARVAAQKKLYPCYVSEAWNLALA